MLFVAPQDLSTCAGLLLGVTCSERCLSEEGSSLTSSRANQVDEAPTRTSVESRTVNSEFSRSAGGAAQRRRIIEERFLAIIRPSDKSDCRAHRGQETSNARRVRGCAIGMRRLFVAVETGGNSGGSRVLASCRVFRTSRGRLCRRSVARSLYPAAACRRLRSVRVRETRAVIASDEIFHRPVTFPPTRR